MRYEFGKNWKNFLKNSDVNNLLKARNSLKPIINKKKTSNFIDLGCGSGVFSLGALIFYKKVVSIDIDEYSIKATQTLKQKSNLNSKNWQIKKGSILDKKFLKSFGKFDMVYCWGVAHHTGDMWKALDNIVILTKVKSRLFIAIYNDQGLKSKFWWLVKFIYNILPKFMHKFYLRIFEFLYYLNYTLKNINNLDYKKFRERRRGMNFYENLSDWIGGYPFEYASIDELKKFFLKRNFKVLKLKKSHGSGCHEILFEKIK